jgi:hypothetical protein
MKILTAIGVLLFVILILRALSSGSGVVVGVEDLPLTEDSVRKLLMQGRKIQAIKVYRTLHRVDLKAAKEAVERLSENLPPSP